MESEELALAWLAGFFDGEGSIVIRRCKDEKRKTQSWQYRGRVDFSQANLKLIEKLTLLVKELELPEPYIYRNPNRKTQPAIQFIWMNRYGTLVLQKILPYLRHPNRIARATIFCKMFAPDKMYMKRAAERSELFIEWMGQRLAEQHEKEHLRET